MKTKLFAYTFITLAFIENLFFSYFHRATNKSDIYLFFTHIEETFETFFDVIYVFMIPFIFFIFSLIFLRVVFKYKSILFLFLILTLNYSAVNLTFSIVGFYFNLNFNQNKKLNECENQTVLNKEDKNIIFIIGESLRSDKVFGDLTPNLNRFLNDEKFISKVAIAGAINTDVSVPLLINNSTNPLEINKCKNLFKLAKNANFKTYFISTQSQKSLKYIDEYLSKESIDVYKDSKSDRFYDEFLIANLKTINLQESNFIVLQLYGEHSPYKRYKNEFEKFKDYSTLKNKINSNYNNSLLYSDFILSQILNYFKNQNRPTYIIFTSDHGEFLGENEKFGHNQFDELIYKVPFFIYSNDLKLIAKFKNNYLISHNEISKLITFLLGYEVDFNIQKEKKVIVNGTMITREDGYIEIDVK